MVDSAAAASIIASECKRHRRYSSSRHICQCVAHGGGRRGKRVSQQHRWIVRLGKGGLLDLTDEKLMMLQLVAAWCGDLDTLCV